MTRLRAARALVTGAGGFVGPFVAALLRERGATVHGLGSEAPAARLGLEAWHPADLREPETLARALAAVRPHLVVHLAGQSSAARSFEQPTETFHVNALGTWNLLEAVRHEVPAARVLVVGSGEVYGPQPDGTRAGEQAPLRPVSPYALSKAAADAFAEIAARRHMLDVVRTRSFAHTGPGQEPRFVIPSFAQQIAEIEAGKQEPVVRVGNLEVTRDLTDVRDVAEAYVRLLERGQGGAAYNVCRGTGVRLDAVLADLVAAARVPIRVEVDPARLRPADVPYLVGDPAAIERDTGWRAEIPLEQTLGEMLQAARRRAGVAAAPPPA